MLALPADLEGTGAWALEQGAVGVVVRMRGDGRGYWWGPGEDIPFNKADLLPRAALRHHPRVAPRIGPARAACRRLGAEPYLSYGADRAWSSMHPEEPQRRRRLFDGELRELLVMRSDPFCEDEPHLRGMIRNRTVEGSTAP